MEIPVPEARNLPEGGRLLITRGNDTIGVIRANGKLHAFLNRCPHQGGPVCDGLLIHKVEEVLGEDRTYRGMRFNLGCLNLVCPWHGWEFDINTGRCAGDQKHVLRRYKVVERDDGVYIDV